MIDKNTIKDIDAEKLDEFLSAWMTVNEKLMGDAYSIERGEMTFVDVVESFVREGLLIIPYDIGDFSDN